MTSANRTAGKVVLITGSATGVGAASALDLATRGHHVVINYSRSEAEARETEARCRDAGAQTLLVRADVSNDDDCKAMVQATLDKWGRIDALVNNAGVSVFAQAAAWDALDAQAFNRIMGVNVIGSFQMVRACAPHLKSSRGCIVNVSSIAGALGIGSSIPYIASKGALNSMTLHLARTMAPEVRVNAVCPGLITSRWFVEGIGEAGYQKTLAAYENATPLGTACSPEDVAQAIAWLIDGARTVTGELLLLDAGTHLGSRPMAQPQR
ncbi:SDR family NAD(P)-dependent oxidoreductase [Caenimonas sp. SL110]|uniref:SDR family NAD(P)-dependent oxidoreductase n=1 Tax=Caenimonas sp. SL110 TaxID=1450524 RepID=UPI000652BC8D|nr:SDR family oxidoreductase [Caenimonas sp. SL110]